MSDDHGYVGNYPEHVFFNTALTFAQFVWEEKNFPIFFQFQLSGKMKLRDSNFCIKVFEMDLVITTLKDFPSFSS